MFGSIKNKASGGLGKIQDKTSGNDTEDIDPKEIANIQDRLDPDEQVLMAVRQSKLHSTSVKLNTNSIFVTDRRILIVSPKKLGLAVDVEDYTYDNITGIKLVKGMLHSSIELTMPGSSELSKPNRILGFHMGSSLVGGEVAGAIEGLPREKAEKIVEIVRKKIREYKEQRNTPTTIQQQQSPLDLLKTKFVNGEITEEEFEKKKKILES